MSATAEDVFVEARRVRIRYFPLALLLLMALSTLLAAWRIQQFELEIARARSARQTALMVGELERAFGFGMSPRDLSFLPILLRKKLDEEHALVSIRVLDENGEAVAEGGRSAAETGFKPVWNARLNDGLRSGSFANPPYDFAGRLAFDSLGQPAATVWLTHDRREVFARGEQTVLDLLPWGALATLVAVALFAGWQRRREMASGGARPVVDSLVLLSLTLVVVIPIVIKAQSLARPLIDAQISISAQMLGRDVAVQIERATALGVPLNRLPGIETVLQGELRHAREFSHLDLLDSAGRRVASARAPGVPTEVDDATAWSVIPVDIGGQGRVDVGYPRDHVSKMVKLMLGDLLFAVLIAGVLVWELAQAIRLPGLQTAPDVLAELRLFVFAVSLTEELLRPFFAPFAAEADSSLAMFASLSPAWLAGLPVMIFMCALAFSQPIGASLSGRFDLRRAMIVTALGGATALAACGFVSEVLWLSLLRGVNGMTYGLMLIFAQMAILRMVEPARRARALAEFATAIVAAGIVGPALGAIVAERFGFQAAFLGCAVGYAAAAAIAARLRVVVLSPDKQDRSPLVALRAFLRNGPAMAVTALAAVPARLLAAAMLLLITPLYLAEAGEATTVVGRVLPLYFIAFLVTASWIARLSDHLGRRKPFVIAGCLLSGLACVLLPWIGGAVGAAASCLLLGVGQAVLSAPQMALVTELCGEKGNRAVEQGLASFRFIERAGSIAAAPVAAICVGFLGLSKSLAALGIIAALAGLLLLLLREPRAVKPETDRGNA